MGNAIKTNLGAIMHEQNCNATRADYQVYDIVNLNDGTALFYEESKRLGYARVSRMSLDDGSRWGEDTIATLPGDKPESISFRLNNKLMLR